MDVRKGLSFLLLALSFSALSRVTHAQQGTETPVPPPPDAAPQPSQSPAQSAVPTIAAPVPFTLPTSAATSLPATPANPGALAGEPTTHPNTPPASPGHRLTPETELPRETAVETALDRNRSASGSAFGGYGELTLNAPSNGPAIVDLRRFVLFFGHDFNEHIRLYTEIEVEHAVSSSSDQGEVEVEQAYLDGLLDRRLNIRGGLVLIPAGIINTYHEPPSFNGVDRPDVDQFVIPTTWREPGVGAFGELAEGLRYQVYLINGLNANGFSAESAIGDGRQEAQLAHAADAGGVARLDYEPVLGTVFGATGYGATSGNSLTGRVGHVPVTLAEVDARTRVGGFTARAEAAVLFIGSAADLSRALASGTEEQQAAGPVSSRSLGGYVEAAYNVIYPLANDSDQSLTAFARYDYADTQAHVPAGFTPQRQFRRYSGVFGLVWRPIPQIAIKADYRRREFGAGSGYNEWAAAITWLF